MNNPRYSGYQSGVAVASAPALLGQVLGITGVGFLITALASYIFRDVSHTVGIDRRLRRLGDDLHHERACAAIRPSRCCGSTRSRSSRASASRRSIAYYTAIAGPEVVVDAAATTGFGMLVLGGVAFTFSLDWRRFQGLAFGALMVLVLVGIASMFFHFISPGVYAWATLGIFTLLTLVDFSRIRAGGDGLTAGRSRRVDLSRRSEHLHRAAPTLRDRAETGTISPGPGRNAGMCGIAAVYAPGARRRAPRVLRLVRLAASRPGERRHRGRRRRALGESPRDGPAHRRLQRRDSQPAERLRGDGPHALLDDRLVDHRQRAAVHGEHRHRAVRVRPQRQPHQRRGAAAKRCPRDVELDATSDSEILAKTIALGTGVDAGRTRQGRDGRSPKARTRSSWSRRRLDHRVSRSVGRAAAVHRHVRRGRVHGRVASRARCRPSARSTCARSSRAKSSSSTATGCAASTSRWSKPPALCMFEYIYFARPDSVLSGRSIYMARYQMGRALAREHPVDADVVMAVPDSAIPGGIGYAAESGSAVRRRA